MLKACWKAVEVPGWLVVRQVLELNFWLELCDCCDGTGTVVQLFTVATCCGSVSCGAVQGWYSWDVKWVFWLFVLIESAVQQRNMRSSDVSPSFSQCTCIRLAEGSIRIQVSVSVCCSFLSENIKARFSFILSPLAIFWQHKDALTRM